MRGKESRYLKPLMAKMEGLIDYEVNNVTLPLPNQPAPLFSEANTQQIPTIFAPSSPRWSMTDSVSMLRTLSMCGTLGIPGIAVPEEWDQRRPSGRMLENSELEVLQPWLAQGTA